jgi:hypothetical protein
MIRIDISGADEILSRILGKVLRSSVNRNRLVDHSRLELESRTRTPNSISPPNPLPLNAYNASASWYLCVL